MACTQTTLPEFEKPQTSTGGPNKTDATPDSGVFLPLPPREDITNPAATNPIPMPTVANPNVVLPPSSNAPLSTSTTPLNPPQPTSTATPVTSVPVTPPLATAGNGSCKTGDVTKEQITAWAAAAGGATGSIKYMYVPTDLLVAGKEREADLARVGGLKALFHSSFVEQITGFADVSQGHCAVYKIQLEQIWGTDWQSNWSIVTGASPVGDKSSDPAQQKFVKKSSEDSTDEAAGMISAARLAYTIFYPSNYMALAKIPRNNSGIKQTSYKAIGGYLNGIPCGPRKVEVRGSTIGDKEVLYFMTGDPGSVGEPDRGFPAQAFKGDGNTGHNLPGMPSRQISGSESIQQMPNGLLRYIVWRNTGDSGTKALTSGVIDPANPHNGYTLVVGRSCVSCHNNGIRGFAVDTAKMGNGWSTQEEFDPYFQKAQNEYFAAMAQIINRVVGGNQEFKEQLIRGRSREPISYLISRVEGVAFGEKKLERPYSTCRTSKGDKFQMQVENMYKEINEHMSALQGNTAPIAIGSGSGTVTAPVDQGLAAFKKNCATSGCHAAPANTDRLINGKKAIPERMFSNAKRHNPGMTDAERAAIISYVSGS